MTPPILVNYGPRQCTWCGEDEDADNWMRLVHWRDGLLVHNGCLGDIETARADTARDHG